MAEERYEAITVQGSDGYALSVHVFAAEKPEAAVLFIHGMEEHQDRYIPFAAYLREHGYTVMTADLRGHGKTAPRLCHIADAHGDRLLIDDEQVLLKTLKERCPQVPVYLFAHSMGTIIARKWLQTDSRAFGKVVLSGYPNPQAAASAGAVLAGWIGRKKGCGGYSKMLDKMVLGGFAKAVKGAKTPCDWLSVNSDNVKKYIDDPLCGVPFTIGSYDALFRLIVDINRPAMYKDVQESLPILLISGENDPCTGGEKGRAVSAKRLSQAGFKDLHTETLPGMRHEILNETDNEFVYRRILKFFKA